LFALRPKKKYFTIPKSNSMKKWMLLATLFLASAGTSLYAQPPGGGQMSPEQRNAMMKERFKAMGCDDVQADSLIAISNDMRPKQMALRDLEPEARQAKMKEIMDERNKRIEKALPADLAKKVIEALSQQRMGGRGGGGGGNQ
jgi:hypothetical protein